MREAEKRGILIMVVKSSSLMDTVRIPVKYTMTSMADKAEA